MASEADEGTGPSRDEHRRDVAGERAGGLARPRAGELRAEEVVEGGAVLAARAAHVRADARDPAGEVDGHVLDRTGADVAQALGQVQRGAVGARRCRATA